MTVGGGRQSRQEQEVLQVRIADCGSCVFARVTPLNSWPGSITAASETACKHLGALQSPQAAEIAKPSVRCVVEKNTWSSGVRLSEPKPGYWLLYPTRQH